MPNILNKILQWRQSPILVVLIIGHLVFASILGLRGYGLLQELELSVYDLLSWTRSISVPVDNRIITILANDDDQRRFGWPLPDDQLAQLFETVLAQQPNSIGLDIYRDLPVPIGGGKGYEHLTQVLTTHPNIYGIFKFRNTIGASVDPSPALKGTERVGFNDIPSDTGGTIRRGLLYMGDENATYEVFGLKLALHYLIPKGITPQPDPSNPNALMLGKSSLEPIDPYFGGYVNQDTGGFQIMLTYPGAPSGFQALSFTQVLTAAPDNLRKWFKDKIVIVGVNAEATPDFVYTPFGIWLRGEQRVPGSMIHAYLTSQLIRMALGESRPLYSWTDTQELLWIWLWCLASAFICLWARSLWRFSLTMLSGVLILLGLSYLAFTNDVWIIVMAPALGWILSFLLMLAHLSNQDKQHRTVLMQIFSKHVSKDVAEAIWNEREQYLNEGRLVPQRLTATVLFTDLQGFTSVSEQMEPTDLMNWLNQYMETMVNIVEKQYNGQVNKFIGDAIMAVFGVPLPSTTPEAIARDAVNAVACALAMRNEMARLCQIWQSQGLPLIRMRIGIFTGPVIVGSLGSVERQEYTVLGDTVNTASRLESYDKTLDADNLCRILISDSTLQYLCNQLQIEPVGEVSLKGKQTKLTIYRVVS